MIKKLLKSVFYLVFLGFLVLFFGYGRSQPAESAQRVFSTTWKEAKNIQQWAAEGFPKEVTENASWSLKNGVAMLFWGVWNQIKGFGSYMGDKLVDALVAPISFLVVLVLAARILGLQLVKN